MACQECWQSRRSAELVHPGRLRVSELPEGIDTRSQADTPASNSSGVSGAFLLRKRERPLDLLRLTAFSRVRDKYLDDYRRWPFV